MALLYSFAANWAASSSDFCKSVKDEGSGCGLAGVTFTSADGFGGAVGLATDGAALVVAEAGFGDSATCFCGGGAVSAGNGGAADSFGGPLFAVELDEGDVCCALGAGATLTDDGGFTEPEENKTIQND